MSMQLSFIAAKADRQRLLEYFKELGARWACRSSSCPHGMNTSADPTAFLDLAVNCRYYAVFGSEAFQDDDARAQACMRAWCDGGTEPVLVTLSSQMIPPPNGAAEPERFLCPSRLFLDGHFYGKGAASALLALSVFQQLQSWVKQNYAKSNQETLYVGPEALRLAQEEGYVLRGMAVVPPQVPEKEQLRLAKRMKRAEQATP